VDEVTKIYEEKESNNIKVSFFMID